MQVTTSVWTPRRGWATPLPDGDGEQTLVLVLGGARLTSADQAVGDVVRRYPTSVLVGCSTAGEFDGSTLYDDSLVVAVVRFADTRIALRTLRVDGATSRVVGARLARDLVAHAPDLAAVLVLSDGSDVNGSALAQGLAEGAADGARPVAVTGGLAGDGTRFGRTWVLDGGAPTAGRVTAVGLYGERLDVGYASRGGWSILGPERVVTRSTGNVLLELDGLPALELYKTYLGERAGGLPATALLFPLALRSREHADREVMRTVLGVDEVTQSMTFAGDVPEGSVVQLMRGTSDRLVDAALDAGTAARTAAGPDPSSHHQAALALAISCVGRRVYLGQRVEDELDAVAEGLGPDYALVGFYSYGELSPLTLGGCDLHNQTMTVTVLRERAA
jgi:hypothetical protein